VINDKLLEGSVATYLGRGGIVNNHIKKGLLLSLPVKKSRKIFNISEYLAYIVTTKRKDCVVHFVRLAIQLQP